METRIRLTDSTDPISTSEAIIAAEDWETIYAAVNGYLFMTQQEDQHLLADISDVIEMVIG